MWPQKVLHTVHFNDLINQWGGISTPSRGSDEFMMLLWILWTRITVPDSRISSASGTVNPSHPTPRARAGRFTVHFSCTRQTAAIIWRATPNIRQISIGEQTSWDFIVRSHFWHKERRRWHLKLEAHCDMELRRVRVPLEDVWRNGFLYGTSLLRRFLRSTADLIRSTYRKGLLVTSTSFSSSKLLHWASLFPHTFKEPSMKSRSGCWQLHINGYEIRNTLTITEISLHLNRARLLIRRIYCFPNTFASRSRRFRTPKVEGKTPKVARADSVTVLQMCSGSVLTIV